MSGILAFSGTGWELDRITMSRFDASSRNLDELIEQLEKDRAWLLEQIDSGRWSQLRLDLAALERELGHLLTKMNEGIEDGKDFKKST